MHHDIFQSVADQMMRGDSVELDGKKYRVRRTSAQHLRMTEFLIDGEPFAAIEQNPDKPSRWGALARKGHKVVQIKSGTTNRFVAVVVDGEVREYGKHS